MKEGLDRGERLLPRHAGPQAREDVRPAAAAVVDVVPVLRHLCFHRDRDTDARHVAVIDAVEFCLRVVDDCGLGVVDRYGPADDLCFGCETTSPVIAAEHRDTTAAALAIVLRAED